MTRLELLCEEMKQNLVNMGFAPHLELSDCIVPIFSAKGDLVLGSGGTYLHAATGAIPVKYMLKHFANDPSVGIRDGDLFLCNEPIYGGIHLPDFICFIPHLLRGRDHRVGRGLQPRARGRRRRAGWLHAGGAVEVRGRAPRDAGEDRRELHSQERPRGDDGVHGPRRAHVHGRHARPHGHVHEAARAHHRTMRKRRAKTSSPGSSARCSTRFPTPPRTASAP